MDPAFTIDTHALQEHPASWSFPITPQWCERSFPDSEAKPTDAPGTLEVELTKSGDGILVRGRIRVVFAATCVRCLGPTPVPVDVRFDVLYVHGAQQAEPARTPHKEKKKGEEEEDDDRFDEGPDVERFQGHTIVLDRYVRDTVLLELPMNPRCPNECGIATPGAAG